MDNENNKQEVKAAAKEAPFTKILPLIALLISLGCLLVLLYQSSAERKTTLKLTQSLESTQQALEKRIDEQAQSQQVHLEQLQNELLTNQSQTENLQKNIIHFSKINKAGDEYWQLSRANHLLSLAHLSLSFEQNAKTAVSLLESTDNLIKNLNNPQFTPLRQTLSNEINALKAVPQVDKEGLLTKLASLRLSLKNLPLGQSKPQMPTQHKDTPLTKKDGWRAALDNSINKLSKLVVIRQNKKSISALMPPLDRKLLLEQLNLCLQQAQWAIIYKDKTSFKLSLKQALGLLESHFTEADTNTKAITISLKELMTQEIAPKFPDISLSKIQLNKLTRKQRRSL